MGKETRFNSFSEVSTNLKSLNIIYLLHIQYNQDK